MLELWNSWFADFQWRPFLLEVLGKATGVLVGIAASWFLLIRRRLRAMERLRSGDSDDVLFQAHYLHPLDDDRFVLLFRSVAQKQTVNMMYDNPAAAELVRGLGDETSLHNPILPTQGTIGFEVLNDAANAISGALANSPLPRRVWMFCLTCEDRHVVRKRCVRCFLIRPEDLKRFHDWDWCSHKILVERPWHWFRVVALHRIARQWADQIRMFSTPTDPGAMPLVDEQTAHRRIIPLSVGLPESDQPIDQPVTVDWPGRIGSLDSKHLALSSGSWPDNE